VSGNYGAVWLKDTHVARGFVGGGRELVELITMSRWICRQQDLVKILNTEAHDTVRRNVNVVNLILQNCLYIWMDTSSCRECKHRGC
jgi:hypothetical protein